MEFPLRRRAPGPDTLQLNIGLYCNQACSHCHVESSPRRREMMDRATAERCLELARGDSVKTVDITGEGDAISRLLAGLKIRAPPPLVLHDFSKKGGA